MSTVRWRVQAGDWFRCFTNEGEAAAFIAEWNAAGAKRDAEKEADKRLHEAAPDLRDALESLVATVEAAIKSGDWKVDGTCDPDVDIARSRAALAKAEPGHV